MLGKLYITSASTPDKLQSVSDLTAEAIELKITSDATSRNALVKLQTALTRAINEAGIGANRKSVEDEGVTILKGDEVQSEQTSLPRVLQQLDTQLEDTKMEEIEDDTKMEGVREGSATDVRDSILDELLDEDEEL